MKAGESQSLRCHADGNPAPALQWLQQTRSGEVLVRGYESELRIERASYAHQGSFVCSARNAIGEVQSEQILLEVLGRPEIDRLKVKKEHVVNLGEDVSVPVEFCAQPLPRVTWDLGGVGQAGRRVELIAGSTFERYHAGSNRVVSEHCFTTTLVITAVRLQDSKSFVLRVENDYGTETVSVDVIVVDTRMFTEEVFAAIIVGGVLTILLISVIIVYIVRVGCCPASRPDATAGSDKTDVESCGSAASSHHTVIPPDALYGTVKKPTAYFEPEFNNSKEKLRPDLVAGSPYSGRGYFGVHPPGVYGGVVNPLATTPQRTDSQRRKKNKEYRSQGVDCQIASSSCQSSSSLDDILHSYPTNVHNYPHNV